MALSSPSLVVAGEVVVVAAAATLFHPRKFPVNSSQLSFMTLRRTPLDKSVRFALTTRERMPCREGGGGMAEV